MNYDLDLMRKLTRALFRQLNKIVERFKICMKVNPNNNNINAQQLNSRTFPNRIDRRAIAEKLGIDVDGFKVEDVELTLSKQAQSMLTVSEEDVFARIFNREMEEFVEFGPRFSEEFSNEALGFLSTIQLSLGFNQFSGWENLVSNEETRNWLFENAEVAEMGLQLIGGLDMLYKGIDEGATGNAATRELANRYLEMRNSFEARYTGEELETMLSRLSDAFDLVVGHIAHVEGETAERRLNFGRINIMKHNILVGQEQPSHAFNKGEIEVPEDEFQSLIDNVVESIREATNHFARMTRNFVLENGAIANESHIQLLNTFLQSEERPEGRFTFNDLSNTRNILATRNREATVFQQLQQN